MSEPHRCQVHNCTGPGTAVAWVKTGCVHEHLREGYVCIRCLLLMHANEVGCKPCKSATGEWIAVRLLETRVLELEAAA